MPATRKDINVRGHLAGLLRHEEPLNDFIDWFWSAFSAIDAEGSDEDYDLASSIQLVLFELDGDYIDDDEALEALRETADELGVEWRPVAEPAGAPRLAT